MPSADHIIDLLSPSSNEEVALDLSHSAHTHHPDTLTRLRRKASLQTGPQTAKKCRLQPAPTEDDRSILQPYDRVHQIVFKERMSVQIPGKIIPKTLKDGKVQMENLTATKEQNKGYGERISELESQVTDLLKSGHEHDGARLKLFEANTELESQISTLFRANTELESQIAALFRANTERKNQSAALFRANTELEKQIAALLKSAHEHDEARLRSFRANTLVDLVKRVFMDLNLNYPGNLDEAALSLDQQQLESFFKDEGKTLGQQYFKVLQNITQYIDERNEKAHQTSTEFAILLNSDQYKETREYYKWGNLFPHVYGKSVVEIAKKGHGAAVEHRNQNAEDVEWGPV